MHTALHIHLKVYLWEKLSNRAIAVEYKLSTVCAFVQCHIGRKVVYISSSYEIFGYLLICAWCAYLITDSVAFAHEIKHSSVKNTKIIGRMYLSRSNNQEIGNVLWFVLPFGFLRYNVLSGLGIKNILESNSTSHVHSTFN